VLGFHPNIAAGPIAAAEIEPDDVFRQTFEASANDLTSTISGFGTPPFLKTGRAIFDQYRPGRPDWDDATKQLSS